MCNSHHRASEHALESKNQSSSKIRPRSNFLHHRIHHGFRHHPRRRGEQFQPVARSNLVVHVELRGANSLYVSPFQKPSFSSRPKKTHTSLKSSPGRLPRLLSRLFTNSEASPGQHRISDEETEVNSSASSRWILLFKNTFQKPAIFTESSFKGSRSGGSAIQLRAVPPLAHENHRISISAAKKPWQQQSGPSYGSEEHILWSNRVHVRQEIDMA